MKRFVAPLRAVAQANHLTLGFSRRGFHRGQPDQRLRQFLEAHEWAVIDAVDLLFHGKCRVLHRPVENATHSRPFQKPLQVRRGQVRGLAQAGASAPSTAACV